MKKEVLLFVMLLCSLSSMAIQVVSEDGTVISGGGDVNCPFNINVGTGSEKCNGASIVWTDSSGQQVSWACTSTTPPASGWNYSYHCDCPTDWQLPLQGASVQANCWMQSSPGGAKWIKIEMQTVNIHNS